MNAVPVPLLAAVLSLVLLRWLVRRLGEWQTGGALPPADPVLEAAPETTAPRQAPSRRLLLQALGATAAVAAVAGVLAATIRGAAAVVSELRSKLALPARRPGSAVPPGAEVRLDAWARCDSNKDFYRIDTALRVPVVDPGLWTLKVTGLVEHEISLDFATLLAKPLIERHITIACVSNAVRGPDRERPLARLAGPGTAGTRGAEGRRGHGPVPQHGRLDRRHPAGGADGQPGTRSWLLA